MRQEKCATCGTKTPLSSLLWHAEAFYCEACAAKKQEEAAATKQTIEFSSVVDPTVCLRCGADNGSVEYTPIAGLPYCQSCSEFLYNRPLPGWLQLSLAGLILLLGYSLVHGAGYFQTGRSLVEGERLVEQKRYAEAAPRLQEVVTRAPDCEKCILLLGKAYFLSGQYNEAWTEINKHNGGTFKDSSLAAEVSAIARRVDQALGKVQEANPLAEEEKWEEAAAKMREAAQLYPESPDIAEAVVQLEAAAAFERKDYDAFLRIAEAAWAKSPDSPRFAAQLSSALACKYAVTGDPAYRARAEEMLEKSKSLVPPEQQDWYDEYSERIRHRLDSRTIIDADEYNRRFRQKGATKKG